jgi:hypothetical protein
MQDSWNERKKIGRLIEFVKKHFKLLSELKEFKYFLSMNKIRTDGNNDLL